MKTYDVELRRTSYINVTVEADNEEHAEKAAWHEIETGDYKDGYGDWNIESIEEINKA